MLIVKLKTSGVGLSLSLSAALAITMLVCLAISGCDSKSASTAAEKLNATALIGGGESTNLGGDLSGDEVDPWEYEEYQTIPYTDPQTGMTITIIDGRVIVSLTNTPQLPVMDPNYFDVQHTLNEPYYATQYHPLDDDPAVHAFIAAEMLQVYSRWPEIGAIGVLLPPGGSVVAALQDWPTEYPNVIMAVEPDAIIHQAVFPQDDPNDYFYLGQWSLDDPDTDNHREYAYHINIQEAWRRGYIGSANVVVAIIDSGVEWDIPDLQPYSTWIGCNVYDSLNSTQFHPRTQENGGEPCTWMKNYNALTAKKIGHGTFVAGIIASGLNNDPDSRHVDGFDIAGIAPSCKYFPVAMKEKYKPGQSGPTTSTVNCAFSAVGAVKGIYDYRQSLVGKPVPYYNIEVINYSLGSYAPSPSMYAHIINLSSYVNIACAEGNDNYIDVISYPAFYTYLPGVLAVGGYNQYGFIYGNYPTYITIDAPAVDIWSYDLVGVNIRNEVLGYVDDSNGNLYWSSGNSASTAIVSGALALVVSRYPTLTPLQVKQRLVQNSHLTTIQNDILHHYRFFRCLDVYNALSGT